MRDEKRFRFFVSLFLSIRQMELCLQYISWWCGSNAHKHWQVRHIFLIECIEIVWFRLHQSSNATIEYNDDRRQNKWPIVDHLYPFVYMKLITIDSRKLFSTCNRYYTWLWLWMWKLHSDDTCTNASNAHLVKQKLIISSSVCASKEF